MILKNQLFNCNKGGNKIFYKFWLRHCCKISYSDHSKRNFLCDKPSLWLLRPLNHTTCPSCCVQACACTWPKLFWGSLCLGWKSTAIKASVLAPILFTQAFHQAHASCCHSIGVTRICVEDHSNAFFASLMCC